MAHSVDLLDEREPIAGSVVFSIFLHVGVIVFVVGYGLYAKRMQAPFGEPNASAGIAVAVTPVSTIPIPKRQREEHRQQQRQQETKQNQIATRVPQAAVSPMYNMNTGSNGVGIGPNSP